MMNTRFYNITRLLGLRACGVVTLACTFLVVGCESTESEVSADPGINTGVFIDSPVMNLRYRTSTQSGVTNELGEYNYRAGESVIFSIGGIDLPATPASSVVTPLDLVGTDQVDDPVVLNISRLLISLDEDGNPDNGIVISEQAISIAESMTVDFASTNFDESVANLVANSGAVNTVLVSAIAAQRHLQKQLALIPPDKDGDGVIDTEDEFPFDPEESVDTDGDGVGDNSDYAINDPAIQTICQTDASVQDREAGGCNNIEPVAVFEILLESVAPLIDITLDGSQSYDPEGQPLTYKWTIAAKPDGAETTIRDDTLNVATWVAGDLEGEYTIRLTVTDEFNVAVSTEQVVSVDKPLPAAAGLFFGALLLTGLLGLRRERRHI